MLQSQNKRRGERGQERERVSARGEPSIHLSVCPACRCDITSSLSLLLPRKPAVPQFAFVGCFLTAKGKATHTIISCDKYVLR